MWNDWLATLINTVLDELDLKNKEIKFILYSGSGKAKEVINNVEIICLKEPKVNVNELNKI